MVLDEAAKSAHPADETDLVQTLTMTAESLRGGATARFPGICPVCGGAIEPGDRVYPTIRSTWVCGTCQTSGAARSHYTPGANRDAPGYSQECPTCGVGIVELCLTASGKKRALHPDRR